MRLRCLNTVAGAVLLLAVTSGGGVAQGITVSPLLGAYTQANSVDQLRGNVNTMSIERQSALALGANLEVGFFRASLNYVSGATMRQSGNDWPQITGDVGTGRILMGAADAVFRPIPRLVVLQPYALAGIGFKNFSYDPTQNVRSALGEVKDHSTAAFHAGLGADVMFGGVGIVGEVTDYMSQGQPDSNGHRDLQHDAYGMLGLRFKLF